MIKPRLKAKIRHLFVLIFFFFKSRPFFPPNVINLPWMCHLVSMQASSHQHWGSSPCLITCLQTGSRNNVIEMPASPEGKGKWRQYVYCLFFPWVYRKQIYLGMGNIKLNIGFLSVFWSSGNTDLPAERINNDVLLASVGSTFS